MNFDPKKVTVIVDGMVLTGYADGSTILVEHNADAVTAKTGIQGDTAYADNADQSGHCKVTLFNTSASLVRLRQLAQQKKTFPLTVRNANTDGGFIVSANDCKILKVPGFSGGGEPTGQDVDVYIPRLAFN